MGLLDTMQSVASTVNALFETTATLITPGTETLDPATGSFIQGVESTQTISCSTYNYSLGQIDGTRILAGDMAAIIPWHVYGSEPTTAQKIQLRGREYQIINVKPYSVNDGTAAWEVQLRA